ncbi:serine hydrolase domain-containing protein [Flavilitoribacter nigricans]|nr:serine hydrolase domain-containing protein [Flavilitoribacter nigricans]
MKNYCKISLLILSACLLFRAPIAAQSLPQADIDLIERLITEKMAKDEIPGLSIAIVKDGKLAWANGYGFADLENFVPAKTSTVYRTASIGKSITATAIMQLVEGGQLDLNAPIQQYCPAFPAKQWPITTRQLLNHTSGIRHYGGPDGDRELVSKVHYEDVVTPLQIFKEDSLLFEPGSRYQYSTYGYNVLGCVLEGASGQTFATYLQEHLFRPAGMSATQVDDPYRIVKNRARGYQKAADGALLNSEYVDMSNKVPAGGFITTVSDLAHFAIAFMDAQLVSADTRELMLTPQKTSSGETIAYGYGWGLFPDEKWYGQREAFHGGGTPQVSGVLYLLPDVQFGVVILMNLEGVNERVSLAAKIAKEVLDLE